MLARCHGHHGGREGIGTIGARAARIVRLANSMWQSALSSRRRSFACAARWPVALGALMVGAGLHAQTDVPPVEGAALQRCAAIDDAAQRLSCYDGLAGRGVRGPAPAMATEGPVAPAAQVLPTEGSPLRPSGSFLTRYWELDRASKRGTFNFIGYRPNFMLPVHYTDRINRNPQSPTREAVSLPDYRQIEAKLQISIRTKIAQGVLLPEADVWFGFTQQSLWQLWNARGSAPFRNTDYEPELIYIVPVPQGLQALPAGWRWRFVQAGVAHQSNGQAKPLSRSWNRVYLGAGVERGDYSLVVRAARRLPEDDDDNPDLTDWRGRGDVLAQWTPGLATASLLWRTTFRNLDRGALQLDWTYPVERDQPHGLRWYVQLFTGYGETLTDYNFRQTSLGLGVTLFGF
jgi:phospholipase A1